MDTVKFTFQDWNFEVAVYEWTEHFPVTVYVSGPKGQQVTVEGKDPETDWEVCFEVNDNERGRGYGDAAKDRYVPGRIVDRAIEEYKRGREVWAAARIVRSGSSA